MTGKEKVAAAFSADGSGQIPVFIPYEGVYFRDRWHELTSCPWWYQLDPDIDHQLQWRTDMRKWMNHDLVGVYPFYGREERSKLRIEPRDDGVYLTNSADGTEQRFTQPAVGGYDPDHGHASPQPLDPAETPEEVDKLIWMPDADEVDHVFENGSADLAVGVLNGYGRDLFAMSSVSSPLWSCYDIWGFEGMMTRTLTHPDLIRYACGRFLDSAIRNIRTAARLGVQVIWIEELCMDQVSPETYRSLCLPYLRDLIDAIHKSGMKSILYFGGDPGGKWDFILSSGTDALGLEESKKGFAVDIEDVIERVNGRCTVLGNLDSAAVLEQGTEEELRAEIMRQISAGRRNGGKFIMSLGSPATPDTPVQRVRLYCDLAREIGS